MIDNSGSLVAVYHKAHLFDVDVPGGPKLKESDSFIPGKELIPPVHTPVGNVGMAIVSFPELIIYSGFPHILKKSYFALHIFKALKRS